MKGCFRLDFSATSNQKKKNFADFSLIKFLREGIEVWNKNIYFRKPGFSIGWKQACQKTSGFLGKCHDFAHGLWHSYKQIA